MRAVSIAIIMMVLSVNAQSAQMNAMVDFVLQKFAQSPTLDKVSQCLDLPKEQVIGAYKQVFHRCIEHIEQEKAMEQCIEQKLSLQLGKLSPHVAQCKKQFARF